MSYEVSNITTQSIIGSAGEPYGILICKIPGLFFFYIEFSKRALVILASVLLGLSILPLREDEYPPVV